MVQRATSKPKSGRASGSPKGTRKMARVKDSKIRKLA